MQKAPAAKLLALAKKQKIIRPRDLKQHGLAREYLIRLTRQGLLHRSGRGIYELADAVPTEHHTLALVAKEVPSAIICLLSALRFYGLTTQQPSEVWLGIPIRARYPKISTTAHRIFRYSEESFHAGVRRHRIEGAPLRIFEPAKTVADCFKYRNKIGLDIALEALKDSLRQRKATVDDILRYSKICRVSKVIKPYLEAIL